MIEKKAGMADVADKAKAARKRFRQIGTGMTGKVMTMKS
jgi:conjugal transfer/entry exclusion protein